MQLQNGQQSKSARQSSLRELLQTEYCGSQGLVVEKMRQEGFSVTQASISRDFKELGVVKVRGRYLPQSIKEVSKEELAAIASHVKSTVCAGANLSVIKTSVGAANLVAEVIDRSEIAGVLGTVAGDDTIFVATENKAAQQRLSKSFLAVEET